MSEGWPKDRGVQRLQVGAALITNAVSYQWKNHTEERSISGADSVLLRSLLRGAARAVEGAKDDAGAGESRD